MKCKTTNNIRVLQCTELLTRQLIWDWIPPKFKKKSNFLLLLKICVKIISKKTVWERFSVEEELLFHQNFLQANYFNTDIKKQEIWSFQIFGHLPCIYLWNCRNWWNLIQKGPIGIEPKKGWNYDDYPVCYRWVRLIKICQHTKWKGLLKHHTCGHNNNHNSKLPETCLEQTHCLILLLQYLHFWSFHKIICRPWNV